MKRTALKRITLSLLVVSLALLASLPALAAGTVRMSSTIGPIDAGIVPARPHAVERQHDEPPPVQPPQAAGGRIGARNGGFQDRPHGPSCRRRR